MGGPGSRAGRGSPILQVKVWQLSGQLQRPQRPAGQLGSRPGPGSLFLVSVRGGEDQGSRNSRALGGLVGACCLGWPRRAPLQATWPPKSLQWGPCPRGRGGEGPAPPPAPTLLGTPQRRRVCTGACWGSVVSQTSGGWGGRSWKVFERDNFPAMAVLVSHPGQQKEGAGISAQYMRAKAPLAAHAGQKGGRLPGRLPREGGIAPVGHVGEGGQSEGPQPAGR